MSPFELQGFYKLSLKYLLRSLLLVIEQTHLCFFVFKENNISLQQYLINTSYNK